jgi:probable rRNA maturation factor
MKKNIIINLVIKQKEWKNENIFRNYKKAIENIFKQTLSVLGIELPKKSAMEISVVLTGNQEIQNLNREYRNTDKATNVLSFQVIKEDLTKEIKKQPYLLLGDVFISLEVLKQEAKEQDKSIQDHFSHLFAHSFLHLLGYDHIKDDEAEVMERLEEMILEKLKMIEN